MLDIMGHRAAKASPHWLGVRCMSRAVRRLSGRRARPTGVGEVCCAVARCPVVRGCPPGQGRLARGRRSLRPVPQPLVWTSIVGASCETRLSRGCRVDSSSADGRCGICAACARRCVVVALPVIGRGGQGTRVSRQAGQGGPDNVAPRVHGGVFPVSARGGSGPCGAFHAPYEDAAEGTEDLVQKGRVCRLGLRLSADGGLRLPADRQRPDLVDRDDGA